VYNRNSSKLLKWLLKSRSDAPAIVLIIIACIRSAIFSDIRNKRNIMIIGNILKHLEVARDKH